LSALLCYKYQVAFKGGAGDLSWPLCAARAVVSGSDPYACPHLMSTGKPGPTNPLTTALVVILFTPLNAESAAGVFFGLSSALLAFGLTRHGDWWRLLVFLAFPYWAALQAVQWSPLLSAVRPYPALF